MAGVGSGRLSRAIRRGTDSRAYRSNVAMNSEREESIDSCIRAATSPMARMVEAEASPRATISAATA